jgi:predicted dehydrogenase
MSVRFGLIGAGTIGNIHANALVQMEQPITAVFDIDEAAATKAAEAHGIAHVAPSRAALLERDDVDAIVVAVPNRSHKEVAVASMQAGKDVLLEKPMAMNVAECDEIISAMEETKRICQMGFVLRGSAVATAARRFIDEGRFGEIYHAKASIMRRRGIPGLGGWFTTRAESGGGPLIDLGVHAIDLSTYLAGRPTPTRASGACYAKFGSPLRDYNFVDMWAGPPDYDGVCDVEDAAMGLVRFDNEFTLEVNTTWAANLVQDVHPTGIALWGDRGGCFIEIGGDRITIVTEECGHLVDVTPLMTEQDVWVTQFEKFIHAVETREQPDASAYDGRRIQSILDALYRSSEQRCEVPVT